MVSDILEWKRPFGACFSKRSDLEKLVGQFIQTKIRWLDRPLLSILSGRGFFAQCKALKEEGKNSIGG